MDPLLLQAGVAGPLVLALALYVARRRGEGDVQWHLSALLLLILAWMVGMVAMRVLPDGSRVPLWVDAIMLPAIAFMSPVFMLMMARYARIELFVQRREASWAVLVPFAFFLVAIATNDWHGLVMRPGRNFLEAMPTRDARSLFWAFQLWTNLVAIGGLGICLHVALTTPLRSERRRMWLLFGGALLPLVTHASYVFHVLPFGFPLTPAALGVTALLVVTAIQRYRLLEVGPVARRDVIEASHDAVVISDADEQIVDANPAALQLLDTTHERLLGRPLEDLGALLGPTDTPDALRRLLHDVRSDGGPARSEVETAQGRVLEVSLGSARDAAGSSAGLFAVLRDRSSERRAERLLRQSQKLESVGILAAGVAHEVNNPLAFVRSNLAHLQHLACVVDDHADSLPKEVREDLNDMGEVIEESLVGLDRIHGIVQGLLRFSRLPTNREAACDANEALSEAARFASLGHEGEVEWVTELAEDLPPVAASAEQLIQVLLNLLLNARHALDGRTGGRVTVSTTRRGEGVEIRIRDNGPGIPETLRDKIFDPFFTTRAPGEGTGLGLSIAFDIVREHGGRLELETSSDGGATFVVRLPAATD